MIEAKRVPHPKDFFNCPVWRFDEEDDLYHPVTAIEQLPDSERLLSIRATFTTAHGETLAGYVVGIERIFSFGLFGIDEIFPINTNMPEFSFEQLHAFLQSKPDKTGLKIDSIFPLSFRTTINQDPYVDFSGRFETIQSEWKKMVVT